MNFLITTFLVVLLICCCCNVVSAKRDLNLKVIFQKTRRAIKSQDDDRIEKVLRKFYFTDKKRGFSMVVCTNRSTERIQHRVRG